MKNRRKPLHIETKPAIATLSPPSTHTHSCRRKKRSSSLRQRDGRGVAGNKDVAQPAQPAQVARAQAASKHKRVIEHLDDHLARGDDDGSLHGAGGRAGKVVRVAVSLAAVQGADHARVAGVEHLEQVELAAAGRVGPARAAAVLLGARDEGVEGPDGGHVAARRVERHGELEQEELRGAAEAVVRHGARPIVAAAVVRGAQAVREDDDLGRRWERGVGEHRRAGGVAGARGGGVGERGAEGRVPDSRGRAAVVVQECQARGGAGG